MSINDQLLDLTVERAIVLNRYSAGTGRKVVDLLSQAQADIIEQLPRVTGAITRRRMLKQLEEISDLIGQHYTDIELLSLDELTRIAEIESQWQIKSINTAVGVEIMRAQPTAAALEAIVTNGLIMGNTAETWWRQQSLRMQQEFARVVRLGMAQSETNQQIAKRIRDAVGVQQRHAFALVKTATQAVAVQAREESLKKNSDVVKGKISNAVLDGHTTLVCASYDQAEYDLENKPIAPNKKPYLEIPRHFGCRSMWSTLLKKWDEMGLPFDEFSPSTRASVDGQIPAKTDFAKFLDSKSTAWQDKYLGKGRAELYRKGQITLGDMVDGIGRELTLEQLRDF